MCVAVECRWRRRRAAWRERQRDRSARVRTRAAAWARPAWNPRQAVWMRSACWHLPPHRTVGGRHAGETRGVCMSVNRRWCSMLGVSRRGHTQSILGKTVWSWTGWHLHVPVGMHSAPPHHHHRGCLHSPGQVAQGCGFDPSHPATPQALQTQGCQGTSAQPGPPPPLQPPGTHHQTVPVRLPAGQTAASPHTQHPSHLCSHVQGEGCRMVDGEGEAFTRKWWVGGWRGGRGEGNTHTVRPSTLLNNTP